MQQNTKPHELPMPVDAADSSSLLGEKLGGNVSGCLSDSSASSCHRIQMIILMVSRQLVLKRGRQSLIGQFLVSWWKIIVLAGAATRLLAGGNLSLKSQWIL